MYKLIFLRQVDFVEKRGKVDGSARAAVLLQSCSAAAELQCCCRAAVRDPYFILTSPSSQRWNVVKIKDQKSDFF